MSSPRNSKRYRDLIRRLNEIKKHMIGEISVTGDYSARRTDMHRAYILLVHAELEHYLEDIVSILSQNAKKKWSVSGKSTKVLTSLLAYTENDSNVKAKDKHNTVMTLDDRITLAITRFNKIVHDNHGIKEDNVLKLFIPVGIDLNTLDQTMINTMNSLGSRRGETAHKTAKAQTVIDPISEIQTVNLIVNGLEQLDLAIITLSKK